VGGRGNDDKRRLLLWMVVDGLFFSNRSKDVCIIFCNIRLQ
jgi:hypothetical protein